MITEEKQIVKLWENKVGTQPNMNDENHIALIYIGIVEQGWDINQRSELFSMLNEDESWWNKMSKDQQAIISKNIQSHKSYGCKKEKEKEDKPKTKGDVKTSEPISGINDIQTDLENKRDKGVGKVETCCNHKVARYCNE